MFFSFGTPRQSGIEAENGRKNRATDGRCDDGHWQIGYAPTDPVLRVTRQERRVRSARPGEPGIGKRTLSISLTRQQPDAADPRTAPFPGSKQRARDTGRGQIGFRPPLMVGVSGSGPSCAIAGHRPLTSGKATQRRPEDARDASERAHACRLGEMSGDRIAAKDGEIGPISDWLIERDGREIRCIVRDAARRRPDGRIVSVARPAMLGRGTTRTSGRDRGSPPIRERRPSSDRPPCRKGEGGQK